MVNVTLLRQSNLQGDHYHSMLISLLRGLAALQVAAAHLRAEVYPSFGTLEHPPLAFKALAFGTGFAHLAVVVFFVLSGWLVGGSLLNKAEQPDAFKHYAVDRVTRLWIVLVPTFAAIVAIGLATGWLDPTRIDLGAAGDYSAGALLGNLVGLQYLVVPAFGGNFPLWSLSNETWYYVLFPLLVVIFRTRSPAVRVAAVTAVLAIALLLSNAILLYFAIWLLGAVSSRIKIETSAFVRSILLTGFAGLAVYFRMKGKNDDLDARSFVQDLIFSASFVLVLCSMQFRPANGSGLFRRVNRIGQFFADFSFTLYVVHIPVIGLITYFGRPLLEQGRLAPDRPSHYGLYLALYVLVVVASYLFYLPFEAKTQRLRTWVKRLVIGRAVARA